MKITCNYDNNCNDCKHQHTCILIQPTNKKHTLLLQEINFHMKKLHQIRKNLIEYEDIFDDINNNDPKYSGTVNVYGSIKHYPKQNAYGVFIKKPEHVNYGWNRNKMLKEKDDLMEYIRMLNRRELNIRKILLKQNEVIT